MKACYSMVGMKYRNAESFVASLPRGEPISLVREPRNQHDRNAVQVWARGQLVAYVLAREAAALALRMDKIATLADDTALPRERCITGTLTFGSDRRPIVEVEE